MTLPRRIVAVLEAVSGTAAGAGENVAVLYENEAWMEAVSSGPADKPMSCWRREGEAALAPVVVRQLLTAAAAG